MTNERTLSRSEKVGAFSILKNVRDHGIRSATDEDEVNGIRLACAVVLEGFDSIPELPPVYPENLVEGEWYVVKDGDWERIGRPFRSPLADNKLMFDLNDDRHWGLEEFDSIHGPLRFRIGGAS